MQLFRDIATCAVILVFTGALVHLVSLVQSGHRLYSEQVDSLWDKLIELASFVREAATNGRDIHRNHEMRLAALELQLSEEKNTNEGYEATLASARYGIGIDHTIVRDGIKMETCSKS